MLEDIEVSNFSQFYYVKLEKDLNNDLKFIFEDQDILEMISKATTQSDFEFHIHMMEQIDSSVYQ